MIDLKKLRLKQIRQDEYTRLREALGLYVDHRKSNHLFGFCEIRQPLAYQTLSDFLADVADSNALVRDVSYKTDSGWFRMFPSDLRGDAALDRALGVLDAFDWFVLRLYNTDFQSARHNNHEIGFDFSTQGLVSTSCIIPGSLRQYYSWEECTEKPYVQFTGLFPEHQRSFKKRQEVEIQL